jgi:hypothetical protein
VVSNFFEILDSKNNEEDIGTAFRTRTVSSLWPWVLEQETINPIRIMNCLCIILFSALPGADGLMVAGRSSD